jgi:hypothetical protein
MMQELNQLNINFSVSESNLENTMPFGESSTTYFPLVRGEYTNLLLQ